MSTKKNLQDLFDKAAAKPVEASFDETRKAFLKGSGGVNSTSAAQGGKGLIIKIGLVMITLIGGLAVALFLFQPDQIAEEKLPEEIKKITADKTTVSVDEPSQSSVENTTQATLDELVAPTETFYAKEDQLYITPSDDAVPIRLLPPPRIDIEGVDPLQEEPKVLPTLSEDDIKDNNKRKKKMLQALMKRDKRSYAYIPSGSFTFKSKPVSVQAFFMGTAEVTNEEYGTFLNDLIIQRRDKDYWKARPDESLWGKLVDGNVFALEELYFSHPAFAEYPVNNVSREGAEMYCRWLSEEVRKFYGKDKEMMINDVRLPYRAEWALAASVSGAKMPYPWGGPAVQNQKGCYLTNFDATHFTDAKECEDCDGRENAAEDGGLFTVKTKTYMANEYGLFNMSGNVAEMVYESKNYGDLVGKKGQPGTAGGGWMSDVESLKIDGKDNHAGRTEGHPNIGFRVVFSHLGSQLIGTRGAPAGSK